MECAGQERREECSSSGNSLCKDPDMGKELEDRKKWLEHKGSEDSR